MTAQQLYKVTPQVYLDRFMSSMKFHLDYLYPFYTMDDLQKLSYGERKELVDLCAEDTRRNLGLNDFDHKFFKAIAVKAIVDR